MIDNKSERYNLLPAAAFIRGQHRRTGSPELPEDLLEMPLEVLTDVELLQIVEAGEAAGL